MKGVTFLSGVLLLAVAGQVAAQCTANRVTRRGLDRPCYRTRRSAGRRRARAARTLAIAGRNIHDGAAGSGPLIEWAKGPNDPVDPTHQVGTWLANGRAGTVTYSYNGGGSYTWLVYGDGGGVYSFCTGANGTAVATATIKNGQVGCGF